jgi:hypothetical protein
MVTKMQGTYLAELWRTTLPWLLGTMTAAVYGCCHVVAGVPEFFCRLAHRCPTKRTQPTDKV